MAVFPPIAESTMARREVGIWTTRTPRMLRGGVRRESEGEGDAQGGCDEADEVADDATAEGEEDGVTGALLC